MNSGAQVVNSANLSEQIAEQLQRYGLKPSDVSEKGSNIGKLYVTEKIPFDKQWYLAITFDRENYTPAILISQNGRPDARTTASLDGSKQLHTFHLSYSQGITPELMSQISQSLGMTTEDTRNLEKTLARLYGLFKEKDVTLLEIDSLVQASDKEFVCLDAKIFIDDASAKRQKDVFALRDAEQEVPEEIEAEKHSLIYVKTDGNIGTVVNGAGLAMATNDVIAFEGGASANFLDAGGQATKETMIKAFDIVLRDTRVKAIMVNVYGGK